MLNSYFNLMPKILFERLGEYDSIIYNISVFCLMYILWYIHCRSKNSFISKEKHYKFEKELIYSSRLYSLLEVLKKLTQEQSHFIDLDLRNDLSKIHWDLVNLEYTVAQIIPSIENTLLNQSRKSIIDTTKEDTTLQETTKKDNEDTSTKVLKDLEDRWRTIRSNLRLNIELIENNSKPSSVSSSCGDGNKRTNIYDNMISIKSELNRQLSSNKKTLDKTIDNKSLTSRQSFPPSILIPPISILDEQIENTMLLDSKNLIKSHELMINDNNINVTIDNKTITVLQDKTQTFYDSESLFSIDMQSSSSLEKDVQENCNQHIPIK